MKKIKLLSLVLVLVAIIGVFAACGGKEEGPTGPVDPVPETPGGEEEEIEQKPEFDDAGNRYVDLVTEDGSGGFTYNGVNAFLEGYDAYGPFEDVHSDVPFTFADGREARDVLGFVHAGGQYNFTEQPYLTEGANLIRNDIGSRVIKLFLGSDIADQYSFNENWGSYESLTELLQEDEIRDVLGMGFTTVVMVAYEFDRLQWNITTAVAQSELSRVQKEFYDFTKELIASFNGSGKTFVLQNWEGDNELKEALAKVADGSADEQTIIDNYIAYNNARQAGIEQARKELFATGNYARVEVLGALEINYISYPSAEKKLIDVVVPYSDADLFSFSDWSTSNASLEQDLETYLAQINKNPDRQGENAATYNDIYLGEYGRKEYYNASSPSEEGQFNYSVETAKIAVNKGLRYVCYWSLMCNERKEASTARPANEDMQGFWLIKPDGVFTETFWYFKGLLENKNFLAGGEKPKVILRQPEPAEEPIPFPDDPSDILFFDNFDDVDLDENPAPELNTKWEAYSDGMQYDHIKAADQPMLSRYFEKYGLTPEIGFTVVQKKHNNPEEEYIQYRVVRSSEDAEGKFVMQGFLYDPTPKSNIKVVGTKNGTDYEPLESVYMTDKTGEYGYLYVTTKIPVGYTSIRVLFTNTKAGNSWDPLICRVAFVK